METKDKLIEKLEELIEELSYNKSSQDGNYIKQLDSEITELKEKLEQEQKDVMSAEEILEPLIITDENYPLVKFVSVVTAMKEYINQFKSKQRKMTDKKIEKYVLQNYPVIMINNSFDANSYFRECLIRELKAMRDSKIKTK